MNTLSSPLDNAVRQRAYAKRLDINKLCKHTIIIPQDYRRIISLYAAHKGFKKQEAWKEIVEAGMIVLHLDQKLNFLKEVGPQSGGNFNE